MGLVNFFKSLTRSQKIAFLAVVCPIILAFFGFINWFGEPLGELLIRQWLASPTPTLIANTTFTSTSINTPTTTSTVASTNTPMLTATTTLTHTNTSTSKPTLVSGTISEGCIPSTWEGQNLTLKQKLTSDNGCINLEGVGIAPHDNGMSISTKATTYDKLERQMLLFPISQGIKSINFNLELTNFEGSFRQQPTLLYFGISSGKDPSHKGVYIVFEKSRNIENISSSYIINRAPESSNGVYSSNYNIEGYIDKVKVEFFFNNKSFMIKENEKLKYPNTQIPLVDIENPKFVIGYAVGPGGGMLSAEITDLNIQY